MMNRKGSALLIVLGMLAFMVVSAVSFAMFMRQSRVPSSYLRRAATSRYLLKAALANAIARLDGQLATERQIGNSALGDNANGGYCEGVYDDPYPGVGPSQNESYMRNGDYWVKRVFCPFGLLGTTEDQNGIPHYQTVATLTLEGLAYLPPAIINEVRLYSRLTRTAVWRNLAFDAGRYAFCAVDVSDCFDLNRLSAGTRRSSAPGERVNLSSLFPQNGAQLDNVLKQCSNYWTPGGGNIPFTSVADFNIVAGKGNAFAPFASYIGSTGAGIYNMGQAQSVSNALFITDTWFPPADKTVADQSGGGGTGGKGENQSANKTTASTRIDLSKDDSENQPFPDYEVTNFMEIDHKGKLYQLLMRNIGGCGLACLYDYLDRNRVPISLALPTTETVPMICGLGLGFDGDLIPKVETTQHTQFTYKWNENNYQYQIQRTIEKCVFKGFTGGRISLSGVAAFPFKHVSSTGARKGSYKVEALAAVFFAENGLRARVAGKALRPTADDWKNNKTVRDGVIWLKGQAQQLSFPDNITKTTDALKQFVVSIDVPGNVDLPVYFKITDADATMYPPGETPPPKPSLPDPFTTTDYTKNMGSSSAFTVYDADGEIAARWRTMYNDGYKNQLLTDPDAIDGARKSGNDQHKVTLSGGPYRPYVAVWARVVDSSQKNLARNSSEGAVVDLVPATCDDDETYLNGCTYPDKTEVYKMCGSGTPLLDFRGDHAFEYTEEDFKQKLGDGTGVKFPEWDTLYALDPRFNYAPEDWFGQSSGGAGGDANPNQWQTLVEGTLGGDRDPDIFMFTSDQEHLQSIGELAFLPRVQEMTGDASFFEGEFMSGGRYNGNNFDKRSGASLANLANGDFMWQTYSSVKRNGSNLWDPIYEMTWAGQEYEVVSGTGDFRVNPFSPDTRVLMAALKDTPADWFFASDDEARNPTYKQTAAQRAAWAFCEQSSIGARLYDDELEDIAAALRNRFADWARRSTDDRFSWEDAFDDMRWYDGQKGDAQKGIFDNYIEADFDNVLHGVDRKFLYSFWRECFQNRQQLFLVFIRAEPLTVGGMGEGSLASAQLGARGVALVWRDPLPPARGGQRPPRTSLTQPQAFKQLFDKYGPHRTRVLFYHQFE